MKKIAWKVDGMDCASCALSITKSLTKQGIQNILVNPLTGDVSFDADTNANLAKAKQRIEGLGYKVQQQTDDITEDVHNAHTHNGHDEHGHGNKYMLRFIICLPFTLVLMLHMLPPAMHIHQLMNPWVQFWLCLPVYIIGIEYFGKSAFNSIKSGVANMNVLISLGATAAFAYSCYGLFSEKPQDYLFFETAASIITIVLFGNYIEHKTAIRTQREVQKLTRQQIVMANMIAYDDKHEENIFPVQSNHLKVGDLVLIKTGEQVPADCKVLWGEAEISEAIITGESDPVFKKKNDLLIGGSLLISGTLKCYVTATGQNTVMSNLVQMVQKAQMEKPPLQLLADKISGIFVPTVMGIALLTFLLTMFVGGFDFKTSMIRSVAVLVIACPCAMGLATPAAIAVGLGRSSKFGILYTDAGRMELFRKIKQVVFDKTGTLTTGKFEIKAFKAIGISDEEFKSIVYSIEKLSNHPIAKSVTAVWQQTGLIRWQKVDEIKGIGMQARDKAGNIYSIGSPKISEVITDNIHQLYVIKNNEMLGWIDIADEIRPEAKGIIDFFKRSNIKTILLSGDNEAKVKLVAEALEMDAFFASHSPEQKLSKIAEMNETLPTMMVGDGINDAPALAKASISVSLAEATQLAIQSASVVLTHSGLKFLPTAFQMGRETYNTVKSNLFWAFLYNIVAIPIAAMGFLSPTFSALAMGGSDVILALNSLWLGVKKINT